MFVQNQFPHQTKAIGITACLFMLASCSQQPYSQQPLQPIRMAKQVQDVLDYEHQSFIGFPTPDNFSVCHDLSCSAVSHISLSDKEWQQVTALFTPVAADAVAERQLIQAAIALLETLVGRHAGTSNDLAENNMIGSHHGQLDCIDESTNTSVYLRLIDEASLLRWHHAAPRSSRGILSGMAPHNTATIIETASGQRFAVDSWFGKNGDKPAIVPLDRWLAGWRPEP